ncbi:MAG: MBL fold metallo-hydrolase [Lachnospiraceae bacterium]|nr:MBL fold metallo-hydrolase [Lachnospiraceae bacterium]
MHFFTIASGSSGNSICIGNEKTTLLVDAGISGKRIEEGLNTYDFTTSDMAGILITHEHADHIGGLGVISRKHGIPIYATRGTINAIRRSSSVGNINDGLFYEIEPDKDFSLGDLVVRPIRISHDAADPVAYRVSDKRNSVAVLTDLGIFDNYIVENMQHLDAMVIESNHDVKMLEVGSYPYPLKQRILSDVGHLSNELSGQLLGRLLHDDMKHIFLGHLSRENNYPELAEQTVKLEVSMGDNPYCGTDFPIEVAPRDTASRLVEL